MNICLLTTTFFPLIGGLEIVVHNLATALADLGHKVYLVTPYRKDRKDRKAVDSYDYNYELIRFGFKGYGRLKLTTPVAVFTLARAVKQYGIDVINAHNVFTPGSWAYFFGSLNKNIPLIGTPHGDDIQITPEIGDGVRIDPQADKIVRRNLERFTSITAISSSMREDLSLIVSNKEKIFDVPNGVWVNRFQKKINCAAVRNKYGIPLDSVAIISVGRNHPRKGFLYGIEAVAKLKKSGQHISYILVGRNMEPIIEKAKALSVSDCLITPGQVDLDTVGALLQSSDIYLSPSIVESFGVATLEAMCAGLPCVATDIAGSKDLISRDCGFLVKSKDTDQMSIALKTLAENSSKRKEMGQKALAEAKKYDWPNIAAKYLDVYRDAIHKLKNNKTIQT